MALTLEIGSELDGVFDIGLDGNDGTIEIGLDGTLEITSSYVDPRSLGRAKENGQRRIPWPGLSVAQLAAR